MSSVHVGDVKLVKGKHDTIFVTRRSALSNKEHTVCIAGTTMDTIVAYLRGQKGNVQDVFPLLSASDREFLVSGITEEEWKKAFGNEGDDEDGE